MKYKVEMMIPLIPRGTGSDSPRRRDILSIRETLNDMPIGGSFLVPVKKNQKPEHVRGSISGAISPLRKTRPDLKFATRLVSKEHGIRVWRIR